MKNITYIFGAGASANSIPLVKEMNSHLLQFRKRLDSVKLKNHNLTNALASFKSELDKVLEEIIKNEGEFGFSTIDSYAKSLSGNERALNQLKKSLTIYFMVLQYVDKTESLLNNLKNKKRRVFENIDHRYLEFFLETTTVKDGKRYWNENIKVLTWNYDIQLELAFQKLIKSESIESAFCALDVIPKSNYEYYDGYYPNPVSKPVIVHLNGIAGLVHDFRSTENQEDELGIYNYMIRLQHGVTFDSALEEMLDIFASYNSRDTGVLETFTFAFERNYPIANKSIKLGKEYIRETDILIIIGYSIPKYNREIDIELFSQLKPNAKIIIQDYNEVGIKLSKDFNIKNEIQWVHEEFRMGNFYIPLTM